MSTPNSKHEPLQIVALTVAVLMVLTIAKTDFRVGGRSFRQVNMLSDLCVLAGTPSQGDSELVALDDSFPVARARADAPTGWVTIRVPGLDSIPPPLPAIPATVPPSQAGKPGTKASASPTEILDYSNGGPHGLSSFLAALASKRPTKCKVRIGYWGDSIIEGDLLTQDLRNRLQSDFGGEGVGYVPITSAVANFRFSVRQSFSDNWNTTSLVSGNNSKLPIGIAGYTFRPKYVAGPLGSDSAAAGLPNLPSWVEYHGGSAFPHCRVFREVSVLCHNTGHSYLRHSFNQGKPQLAPIPSSSALSVLRLESDSSASDVKLEFLSDGGLQVYGASLEGGNGVYLDNFSLRGCSGLTLTGLSPALMQDLLKQWDYRLIILQFGANIGTDDAGSYQWYEAGMSKVIRYFEELFPNTSILLVSSADKGANLGDRYGTALGVPGLVAAQRRCAEKNGIAFWNLFAAMGGEGTVVRWAENGLAAPDYVHFSNGGARRVANLLYDALMKQYERYQAVP